MDKRPFEIRRKYLIPLLTLAVISLSLLVLFDPKTKSNDNSLCGMHGRFSCENYSISNPSFAPGDGNAAFTLRNRQQNSIILDSISLEGMRSSGEDGSAAYCIWDGAGYLIPPSGAGTFVLSCRNDFADVGKDVKGSIKLRYHFAGSAYPHTLSGEVIASVKIR